MLVSDMMVCFSYLDGGNRGLSALLNSKYTPAQAAEMTHGTKNIRHRGPTFVTQICVVKLCQSVQEG